MTARMRLVNGAGLALDTVRLRLDPGAVTDWNRAMFKPKLGESKRTDEVREFWRLDNAAHGVNRIDVYEDTGSVFVQVSAKSLLGDYARGITTGTLEHVADAITRTGAAFVSSDAMASAVVCGADVASDVFVGLDRVPTVLATLSVLRAHPKLTVAPYKGAIQARRPGKGAQDQLMMYDKHAELGRAANRDFLKVTGLGVHEGMAGIVRFERKARTFRMLRACSGVVGREVLLAELLASDRRPVADLLGEWVSETALAGLLDDLEGETTMSERMNALGREVVLKSCGYDSQAVRSYVVACSGFKNAARHMKPFLADIARHEAGGDADSRRRTVGVLDDLLMALRN